MAPLRDSPATPTFGSCCRLDGAASANGQTASACSAAPWAAVCDGFGTLRITSGPKYIRTIRDGGSTWMRVKGPGISHGFTPKAGAASYRTALLSRSMVPRMLPGDMFEVQSDTEGNGPAHRKKSSCGWSVKSARSVGTVYRKQTKNDCSKRTNAKRGSCARTWLLALRRKSTTCFPPTGPEAGRTSRKPLPSARMLLWNLSLPRRGDPGIQVRIDPRMAGKVGASCDWSCFPCLLMSP